jgi:hypothetical protein
MTNFVDQLEAWAKSQGPQTLAQACNYLWHMKQASSSLNASVYTLNAQVHLDALRQELK